jgi:beta-xylosidase
MSSTGPWNDAGLLEVVPDINLLMSPPYLAPPSSQQVGDTAPFGTYIPSIDPNVIFDDDGSIWLFFSRNAYRNWVWSDEFDRYIEESNIYAGEYICVLCRISR